VIIESVLDAPRPPATRRVCVKGKAHYHLALFKNYGRRVMIKHCIDLSKFEIVITYDSELTFWCTVCKEEFKVHYTDNRLDRLVNLAKTHWEQDHGTSGRD